MKKTKKGSDEIIWIKMTFSPLLIDVNIYHDNACFIPRSCMFLLFSVINRLVFHFTVGKMKHSSHSITKTITQLTVVSTPAPG